jgi:hypothetical protein
MRNLVLSIAIAAVAIALVACAASHQEVEVARTARYRGDQLAMFRAARQATADKYQIAMSDETALRIETTGRWYTPEGLGASERNHDMRDVPDRSIHLRMIVRLVPEGDAWVVAIEPVMMRYFTGRPNPDRLTLDDPSLPGWTHGRVDQLHSAIHRALAGYQVQSPGGAVAPPAASGPAAPPASGSAAPPASDPAPPPAPPAAPGGEPPR